MVSSQPKMFWKNSNVVVILLFVVRCYELAPGNGEKIEQTNKIWASQWQQKQTGPVKALISTHNLQISACIKTKKLCVTAFAWLFSAPHMEHRYEQREHSGSNLPQPSATNPDVNLFFLYFKTRHKFRRANLISISSVCWFVNTLWQLLAFISGLQGRTCEAPLLGLLPQWNHSTKDSVWAAWLHCRVS